MTSLRLSRSSLTTVGGQLACAGCPHHTSAAPGCRVVAVGSDVPSDAFLARDPCFLREEVSRFADQWLRRHPGDHGDLEDIVQQAALLVLGAIRRGVDLPRGLPPFLAYLRRVVHSAAIGLQRRWRGRVRCGSCAHYASGSRSCAASGPWRGARLPRSQDPRRLQPPCLGFVPKRAAVSVDLDDVGVCGMHSEEERLTLLDALHALASAHPRAARIVVGRFFEGRRYDELGDERLSLRTLKRDSALGLRFLRAYLSAS